LQYFIGGLPAFVTVMNTIERCEQAAEPQSLSAGEMEFCKHIKLETVTFRYEAEVAVPTLSELNMVLLARRTTALVGSSGAGKSTVADLIMGLVTPASGRVCVDGIPLDPSHVRNWRERIGYVPQDTFLFHDSVRANLLWAHPSASEPEIWDSLRLAAADEFVSRLSEGLDTIVGERGVRLSGGERQRLALARALLRKPSLLILDEATSALDSENERRIQQAIEALHGDMTILIITHRLSTIRGADVIHVLEDGRLVESGVWEDLIADPSSRFHTLWREQGTGPYQLT
jgi:ATP-binding cassette subfamily C protein